MVNIPNDKVLYEEVKKKVYRQYDKPSAYRSGALVREYTQAFKKKYGDKKEPYTGSKSKGNLTRWFKEDWQNQRGETGYKKKGDVYRPTKRVSKNTPATFKELSKKEIREAQNEKKKTGRVRKFKKDN
tara:strand:- start:336 stop:719 length:384 start_codon:yes stop_codon:yes gene_type:complete